MFIEHHFILRVKSTRESGYYCTKYVPGIISSIKINGRSATHGGRTVWIAVSQRVSLRSLHLLRALAFFLLFSISIPFSLLSSPFYALSLLVATQIRGHIAGSSPPSPLRFVPSIFIARRFQLFLPSSTRVELCLPTLGALSSCLLLFICTAQLRNINSIIISAFLARSEPPPKRSNSKI